MPEFAGKAMSNDVYVLDQIDVGDTAAVDDGGGIDWIDAGAALLFPVRISLGNTVDSGVVTSALASVLDGDFTSLLVRGIVENARGGNLADTIEGNLLANVIFGDQASAGAGGDDSITGESGHDTVYGGGGNDTIDGDLGITGVDGNDVLYGNDGNDSINGNGGLDTVEGGLGADTLVGETVSYASSDARVVVSLGQFSSTVSGGHADGDSVFLARGVIGSAHNDLISDSVATFNGTNLTRVFGLGGGGCHLAGWWP
jgi:Ca2+-binding RTX toxin-like protein